MLSTRVPRNDSLGLSALKMDEMLSYLFQVTTDYLFNNVIMSNHLYNYY